MLINKTIFFVFSLISCENSTRQFFSAISVHSLKQKHKKKKSKPKYKQNVKRYKSNENEKSQTD